MAKGTIWMALIAISLIVVAGVFIWTSFHPVGQTGLPGACGTGLTLCADGTCKADCGATGVGGANQNPAVNPAGSYATLDKFTSASVGGTSYYKQGASMDANGNVIGGSRYTTTAFSNVNPGTVYAYWVSNSTKYYVKPLLQTANTLNNLFSNSEAYANTSVSITGYDTNNRQTVTSGAYNTTLGANGIANIEFSYQGVSQTSNLPFGGLFVMEVNQSVTSVTCSAPGLGTDSGKFHITYTPTNTNTKIFKFELDDTFSTGASPLLKRIECEVQNGGSAVGAGSVYKANIYPANYYPGNDGNLYLDVEQHANSGSSTRTGLAGITGFTGYWG